MKVGTLRTRGFQTRLWQKINKLEQKKKFRGNVKKKRQRCAVCAISAKFTAGDM
jgi:hypothetical protein